MKKGTHGQLKPKINSSRSMIKTVTKKKNTNTSVHNSRLLTNSNTRREIDPAEPQNTNTKRKQKPKNCEIKIVIRKYDAA